jgi:hypothetical protein
LTSIKRRKARPARSPRRTSRVRGRPAWTGARPAVLEDGFA